MCESKQWPSLHRMQSLSKIKGRDDLCVNIIAKMTQTKVVPRVSHAFWKTWFSLKNKTILTLFKDKDKLNAVQTFTWCWHCTKPWASVCAFASLLHTKLVFKKQSCINKIPPSQILIHILKPLCDVWGWRNEDPEKGSCLIHNAQGCIVLLPCGC